MRDRDYFEFLRLVREARSERELDRWEIRVRRLYDTHDYGAAGVLEAVTRRRAQLADETHDYPRPPAATASDAEF